MLYVKFVLLPGALSPLMLNKTLTFFSWNVRGLGQTSRYDDVLPELASTRPSFVSLQETKLSQLTGAKRNSFLPVQLASCATVDADGASGGILTSWDSTLCHLESTHARTFSLTTCFQLAADSSCFTLTNVYAPMISADRPHFFAELFEVTTLTRGPWIIMGDFNLTRFACDKNTTSFNAFEVGRFNDLINSLALVEIPLVDHAYTWSNKRSVPTLVRLDRCFVNTDWEAIFPNTSLASLTRVASDHVPLLTMAATTIPHGRCFRFENAWLHNRAFRTYLGHELALPVPGPIGRGFVRRLKLCRSACHSWAKAVKPID